MFLFVLLLECLFIKENMIIRIHENFRRKHKEKEPDKP